MDESTDGDILQGEGVAQVGSDILAADYGLSYLKAVRGDHVCLFTVLVVEQGDACRAVGIVFYGLDDCGNTVFVSLEIDQTQFSLMSAATVAGRQVARGVAAAG